MSLIKDEKAIVKMKHAGKILASVLTTIVKEIKPGVTELELDKLAERLILEKGGEPGFKKVKGYNHTICVATNNVVVHGIPTTYKIQKGDIVCIDCGVYYKGYHTDMAETVLVKENTSSDKKKEMFLETGKLALEKAIRVAKAGNRVGDISKTIQEIVEKDGYSIVRSLVGHGVGKELHEKPEIPGYLIGDIRKTPLLKPGMTIAVEIIYNMGRSDVVYKGSDGWTIQTEDGSLSGVFERTILITKGDPVILTA